MSAVEVLENNHLTNQWLKRLAVVFGTLMLTLNATMAAGVAVVLLEVRDQAKFNGRVATANRDLAEQNAAILRVVTASTSCEVSDTPEQCAERVAAVSLSEGMRRTPEVDCLTRRALAGLPAPDPAKSCVSQTPAHVYPGK